MAILYRIKPQHKKSIIAIYDVVDNSDRRWSVTETYRWGQGFVEDESELPFSDDSEHNVDPSLGWGCELDDLCYVDFQFDDSFTDEEKEIIEQGWEDTGLNWVLEGDHNWVLEGDYMTILGPYTVDKIDEYVYNVSIETVELKPRPPFVATNAWPFSG